MKDSKLIKLCLTISIIGLLALSIYAETANPPPINLKEIEDYLGKTITTSGEVERVSITPNVSFITLREGSFRTTVVTFDMLSTNIRSKDNINVTGQVKLYKGDLEIIAEKIEKLT
jgi:RecJ-like exonuclease